MTTGTEFTTYTAIPTPLTGTEAFAVDPAPGVGPTATAQTAMLWLKRDWDQYYWEQQLQKKGVLLNGLSGAPTDDAPFIQPVIDLMTASGRPVFVTMPPQWTSMTALPSVPTSKPPALYLNSNAGSSSAYYGRRTTGAGDKVQFGSMLTIPSNLAIDGLGMQFIGGPNSSVHGGTVCSAMVLVTSNGATSTPTLSLGLFNMLGLKRIHFTTAAAAQNAFGTATMVIDSASQTGGCQLMDFSKLWFDNCGFNHIYSYGNAALNTYRMNYHNGVFQGPQGGTGTASAGSAMYFATSTAGSGNNESNDLLRCIFDGGGIAITTEGPEVQATNCHFDYMRQAVRMLSNGANVNFSHTVSFTGGHLEAAASASHYDAAGQALVTMTNNQYMQFNWDKPFVYINPAVTGANPLAYIFDSGTGTSPQVAPNGMFLTRVTPSQGALPGSTQLYNPGATGKLVIDGASII